MWFLCTYITVWFFLSAGFNVYFLGQPNFVVLNTVWTLLVYRYTLYGISIYLTKGALVRKALGNKFMFILILESTNKSRCFHPRITQMVKKRGACQWIWLNEGPSFSMLFSLCLRWDAISPCSLFSWPSLLLENQGPQISVGTDLPSLSATSIQPGLLSGMAVSIAAAINYLVGESYPLREIDPCI